jgi:tetratricopeptide (TPR) repeat protein
MRSGSISLAAFMSVLSSSALAAQTGDPNVIACEDKSGAEAIAGCTAAIQSGKYKAKELAVMYFDRALEFGRANDNAGAIADYSEAIRFDPQLAEAFKNRGLLYDLRRDSLHAMSDYSEVIRLAPDADAFNNRGNIYWKQNDWVRALADYNDAIRLNPKYALALYSRGVVERQIGRDAESKADIARALAIDPSLDDPNLDED